MTLHEAFGYPRFPPPPLGIGRVHRLEDDSEDAPQFQVCTKHGGEPLPISNFYLKTRGDISTVCKACCRAQQTATRKSRRVVK